VGIVVLNWNGAEDTVRCLASLRRLTYPDYQVLVVDNGSTDDSVARIRQAFPEVEILETGANLGYSGGNNVGIARALEQGAAYVLVLNNDTRVEPGFLTELVEVARRTGADVVGALVKDLEGRRVLFSGARLPGLLYRAARVGEVPASRWWPTDAVNGSAMLLSRPFLEERRERFGQFLDASLFLYCEEVELALWCKAKGRRSVMAGRAVVFHEVGGSSDAWGPIPFYYLTRNRILLARKKLQPPGRWLHLALYPCLRLLRAGYYALRGRRELARAILLGLRDGLRGVSGPGPVGP
jgi:hypothetical protein